ncbi:hypothetical protein [Solihabitans fulvus]|uniref:hypothetical protein n=1 Tax=Solihabitans fulvus TaxID=1892852 RepID=UPI001661D6DD|nr:hypothetical protein [Solihabitans fulvus]
MWAIIGILLVAWLALGIVGAVVHALFWVGIVVVAIAVGAKGYKAIKGKSST